LTLALGNRHGLVAGATGTGKTVTLQVLAEGFSRAGTAVFAADIKGDLAGIAMPRDSKPYLREVSRRPFSLGADVNQGANNVSAIAIDVIVAGAIDCARSRINASVVARDHGMREPDSRRVVSVNTNMVVVGDRAIGNGDSGGCNRRPYASCAAARAPEAIVVQGHSVESALVDPRDADRFGDSHGAIISGIDRLDLAAGTGLAQSELEGAAGMQLSARAAMGAFARDKSHGRKRLGRSGTKSRQGEDNAGDGQREAARRGANPELILCFLKARP
jgi:Bacterial protein of unknown function (DUF853)